MSQAAIFSFFFFPLTQHTSAAYLQYVLHGPQRLILAKRPATVYLSTAPGLAGPIASVGNQAA